MILDLHPPSRNAGDFSSPFSMDSIFLYIDVSGLEDGEILSEGGGNDPSVLSPGGIYSGQAPTITIFGEEEDAGAYLQQKGFVSKLKYLLRVYALILSMF
jgi:hypothetical protein